MKMHACIPGFPSGVDDFALALCPLFISNEANEILIQF